MSFILLGPAGSGKGTLARTLAQRHGIQIFETGAALRAVAQQDPELARLLAGGNMAPASLVMRLLDDAFQANPGGRLVLDGVPRNPEQATIYLEYVQSGRWPILPVIVLDAPRSILRQRLLDRQICARCAATYGPSATVCDRCHAPTLTRRDDDTPEGIARRFELYDAWTMPAIEQLAQAGFPIHAIDATQTPDRVAAEAVCVLESSVRRPSTRSL